MATLAKAHHELFRRTADECFSSLDDLYCHTVRQHEDSREIWMPPEDMAISHDLTVLDEKDGSEKLFNDWSFSQTCRLAGVSKDTINRLSRKTASKALNETLPQTGKPWQLLAGEKQIRSIHGVA